MPNHRLHILMLVLTLPGCSLFTSVERMCERRDYTLHIDTLTMRVDSVTYVVRDTIPEPPEGCDFPKEG